MEGGKSFLKKNHSLLAASGEHVHLGSALGTRGTRRRRSAKRMGTRSTYRQPWRLDAYNTRRLTDWLGPSLTMMTTRGGVRKATGFPASRGIPGTAAGPCASAAMPTRWQWRRVHCSGKRLSASVRRGRGGSEDSALPTDTSISWRRRRRENDGT